MLNIDLTQIKDLSSTDRNFGRELIDLYIRQSKNQLEEINTNLSNQNFRKIGRVAHNMKASFSMLNCEILSNLAKEIENDCLEASSNFKSINEKIKEFRTLTEKTFTLIVNEGKKHKILD